MVLLRHLLHAAAHAQRAGGRPAAYAHCIQQRPAHLLDADHVGGAGDAHRHTGGDDHQIAVADKARLLRRLHRQLHQLVGALGTGHGDGLHAPVKGHLALHLLLQQQGYHRGLRTEGADHLGGDARLTHRQDGVGTDILGSGAGGVGRGGGDVHAVAAPQSQQSGIVCVGFGFPGDGVHGLHRLHRVPARRRLAGEHDGAGAVVDGVGHVGDLGTGGPGVLDHGVQHLGGSNHRLPGGHALGDHILLDGGDLREVDLHAHVAPCHHNAVRRRQDLRQVVDALLILDLGDDADAGLAALQQLAELPHVGGGADKAGGDEVKALLHAEEDILTILLAHIGHGQGHAGDVDPLVILHDAAVFHPAADGGGGGGEHRQPHQTVI